MEQIPYKGENLQDISYEDFRKKVLRKYKHEITHLLLGLSGIYDYFKQNEKLRTLSYNKMQDLLNDHMSLIQLLDYLTQKISIFTNMRESELLEEEKFNISKDLISKWEFLYRTEATYKGVKFITPIISNKLVNDKPVNRNNKMMSEQIMYNIVTNAIKYSYPQTNIYIDYKKQENGTQIISVTDYGYSIINDQRMPYQLNYRDPELSMRVAEGSGTGLYITNIAAKMINAKIKHVCHKVSEYNIPLLKEYIDLPKRDQRDDISTEAIIEEIERLKSAKIYERVISDIKDKMYMHEKFKIINDIDIQTYEVVFEIIIDI